MSADDTIATKIGDNSKSMARARQETSCSCVAHAWQDDDQDDDEEPDDKRRSMSRRSRSS